MISSFRSEELVFFLFDPLFTVFEVDLALVVFFFLEVVFFFLEVDFFFLEVVLGLDVFFEVFLVVFFCFFRLFTVFFKDPASDVGLIGGSGDGGEDFFGDFFCVVFFFLEVFFGMNA